MPKTRFEYRVARLRAERRRRGKRRAKTAPCWYCRKPFAVNPRGRVRRYCCRSHRQRDYERRRLRKLRSDRMPLTLMREDIRLLANYEVVKRAADEAVAEVLGDINALVRRIVREELAPSQETKFLIN